METKLTKENAQIALRDMMGKEDMWDFDDEGKPYDKEKNHEKLRQKGLHDLVDFLQGLEELEERNERSITRTIDNARKKRDLREFIVSLNKIPEEEVHESLAAKLAQDDLWNFTVEDEPFDKNKFLDEMREKCNTVLIRELDLLLEKLHYKTIEDEERELRALMPPEEEPPRYVVGHIDKLVVDIDDPRFAEEMESEEEYDPWTDNESAWIEMDIEKFHWKCCLEKLRFHGTAKFGLELSIYRGKFVMTPEGSWKAELVEHDRLYERPPH